MRVPLPRTLTSRLVVTAVALVAVVSILVGAVTTLGMRAWLTDRLDGEVRSALERTDRLPPTDRLPVPPPGLDAGRSGGGFGLQVGLVRARFDDQGGSGFVVTGVRTDADTGISALSDRALDALKAAGSTGAETIEIPGLGRYRVAVRSEQGEQVVAALPTDDVDAATTSLLQWEISLALLGILVAGLAGAAIVRRQLRPLTEVAATAHAVTELPLDAGDIDIAERVPERLTDARTEVGQVGLALNQLLAHVESSLSARHRSEQQVRQFVADASHELRTPLTTIAGYTELARRRGTPETAAVALTKIEEESARMTALVEDLLLLARLDAGRPLARERVDLTRLLLEAVNDARVVAPGHRWRLVLPEDAEPIEITGDSHRLHQVVTNLLTNARKYTPSGTTVTVTARPDGFDVHDDGPGFPSGLVSSAFERFTRADTSRQRADGVGLGLALVQAIVAAHGGEVTLASLPGDTRIRVRLTGSS